MFSADTICLRNRCFTSFCLLSSFYRHPSPAEELSLLTLHAAVSRLFLSQFLRGHFKQSSKTEWHVSPFARPISAICLFLGCILLTQERLLAHFLAFPPPPSLFFPVLFWAFFPHSSFVLNEFAGGRESWQENKRICRRLSHFRSICCSLSHPLPPLVLSLSSTGVAVAMMAAFVWHRELCYCIYTLEHPRSDRHTHKRMYAHTRTDPLYQCPRRFIIKAACGRRFEEQNMKRIKQIVWCRRDRHAVRKYLSSSSRWSAQIPLFLSSLSFLCLHASLSSPSGQFQKACIIVYDALLSGD